MAGQIIFFEKSKLDLDFSGVSATASESDDFIMNTLDRSNRTSWMTTGSSDSSNTVIDYDFAGIKAVTDIILIEHNFKHFKITYQDVDGEYVNLPVSAEWTECVDQTTYLQTPLIHARGLKVEIFSTQVPNQEKYLFQFIATERLGQFEGWPVIAAPSHTTIKSATTMMSGKVRLVSNVGAFSCSLNVKALSSAHDVELIEYLYDQREGFLVWLCGGDENQFKVKTSPYRLKDIFLMRCSNIYIPEYLEGFYQSGVKISVDLVEVVE